MEIYNHSKINLKEGKEDKAARKEDKEVKVKVKVEEDKEEIVGKVEPIMMMMTISSVEDGMIGDYLDYYLRLISYYSIA